MKKNTIITALLIAYAVIFILLFVKLRNMSGPLLDELNERNVYYMLGLMFVVGIIPTLYMIMENNRKKYSLAGDTDSFSFDSKTELTKTEQEEQSNKEHVNSFKSAVEAAYKQGGSQQDKLDKAIWKLCNQFELSQALIYKKSKGENNFTLQSSYAFLITDTDPKYVIAGDGLTGQAVKDGMPYFIKDIPEGYLKVISGLGESLPKSLLIIPCSSNGEVTTVFELSSLKEYSKKTFDEIVDVCNHFSELTNQ